MPGKGEEFMCLEEGIAPRNIWDGDEGGGMEEEKNGDLSWEDEKILVDAGETIERAEVMDLRIIGDDMDNGSPGEGGGREEWLFVESKTWVASGRRPSQAIESASSRQKTRKKQKFKTRKRQVVYLHPPGCPTCPWTCS